MSAHVESLVIRPLCALMPAPCLGFVRYKDRPRQLIMCGLDKLFNKPKGLKRILPGMRSHP